MTWSRPSTRKISVATSPVVTVSRDREPPLAAGGISGGAGSGGAVGAWRQHGYGNLRMREAVLIGVLSPIGVIAGTGLSNAISERALELSFAAVQLYFAYGLARRVFDRPDPEEA